MKRKFTELKRLARDAAQARGHDMGPFCPLTTSAQESVCRDCGMTACVDVKPAANGIEIGGEALALNCTTVD